jgi:hypothetical protein
VIDEKNTYFENENFSIEVFEMEWIKDIPFVDNTEMSLVSINKNNPSIKK